MKYLIGIIFIFKGLLGFDAVKLSWLNWANFNVEAKKFNFLSRYGIDLKNSLDLKEVASNIKDSSDKIVEEHIAQYPSDNSFNDIIKELFQDCEISDVEVLNNGTLKDNLCILKHNSRNKCYIILDVNFWLSRKEKLKAVLLHEKSHILFEDNFYKELIQCYAWCKSQDSHQEIISNLMPFCRAYETRADVYALINSDDLGGKLIELLDSMPDGDVETHPKKNERIALLKKIRLELMEFKRKSD